MLSCCISKANSGHMCFLAALARLIVDKANSGHVCFLAALARLIVDTCAFLLHQQG